MATRLSCFQPKFKGCFVKVEQFLTGSGGVFHGLMRLIDATIWLNSVLHIFITKQMSIHS